MTKLDIYNSRNLIYEVTDSAPADGADLQQ